MIDVRGEVLRAEQRIRAHILETPLEECPGYACRGGPRVWFKLENRQHTGSFKVRGALNKLLALTPEERARGVVAASTGNHGAALAYALRSVGARGRVFVPESVAPAKLSKIESLGAEIEKVGNGDIAYLASKNAVGRAVRHRAHAWGRAGVRLNAVAPGPVLTPLLKGGLETPGTGDAIRALENPLGRFGEPDEIASLIAFLLGPDAAFVQGSVYYIDGGIDAHMRPDGF